MKIVLLLVGIINFVFAAEYATLQKISDGDTFTFRSQQHGEFKCRVFGIDTPEKFHTDKMDKDAARAGISVDTLKQAGEASSAYAQKVLSIGTSYKIESLEKDRNDRILCIIHDKGTTYNEAIVADGYAVVYRGGKFITDTSFKRRMLQAQQEAKSKNRGLWHGHTKKIMEGME